MNMIAACCRNRGIGVGNRLPWTLDADLQLFKRLTIGNGRNAVLMGRNTWQSLPEGKRPLPKRANFVLTGGTGCEGATVVRSATDVERVTAAYDQTWVIGGGEIYRTFIGHPRLDKIYLTRIDADFDCDTQFPQIPETFICLRSDRQDPEEAPDGTRHWLEVYGRRPF